MPLFSRRGFSSTTIPTRVPMPDDVPDDAAEEVGLEAGFADVAADLSPDGAGAIAAAEPCYWAISRAPLTSLVFALPLATAPGHDGVLARVIGFCGAGLYEEVLFRLLLLPAVAFVLERLGASASAAAAWAILLTSGLFSLAHYVGPLGDTFDLYGFVFRALAGGFFAVLFLARGFGIVAGTHAAYDILVGFR